MPRMTSATSLRSKALCADTARARSGSEPCACRSSGSRGTGSKGSRRTRGALNQRGRYQQAAAAAAGARAAEASGGRLASAPGAVGVEVLPERAHLLVLLALLLTPQQPSLTQHLIVRVRLLVRLGAGFSIRARPAPTGSNAQGSRFKQVEGPDKPEPEQEQPGSSSSTSTSSSSARSRKRRGRGIALTSAWPSCAGTPPSQ